MEELKANQRQMKMWADGSPGDFQNMYLLVEAETSRTSNNDSEALNLYDEAIKSAGKGEFIQNKALANEFCAKFWLQKGKKEPAHL